MRWDATVGGDVELQCQIRGVQRFRSGKCDTELVLEINQIGLLVCLQSERLDSHKCMQIDPFVIQFGGTGVEKLTLPGSPSQR